MELQKGPMENLAINDQGMNPVNFDFEKFRNKKVLITGHTGFKGSWLTQWLLMHGANVFGISKNIPTQPSLFEVLQLESQINHIILDIREKEKLTDVIGRISPDFIFHLAAQPIVSTSYKEPYETITTNTVGTINILDAIKNFDKKCICVLISSDKCYQNKEWVWGYRESDRLGGKDVYSASKAAGEILFQAYYKSFFENHPFVSIATGRAGNVVGGGDWAADRLIPDCIRSWSEGKKVEIRNPKATRPWQHVLEPLSGYLKLALEMSEKPSLSGESFNFGPKSDNNATVGELLENMGNQWLAGEEKMFFTTEDPSFHEAGLLNLNCDKAWFMLQWKPVFELDYLIKFTSDWYFRFYLRKEDMISFTLEQIRIYETLRTHSV